MKRIKKQSGYAILFAMVIVGVVSLLASGLSSTSYKQLVLSSLVKDSQIAFYKADTASECGLYAYFNGFTDNGDSFFCGTDKNKTAYNLNVSASGSSILINPSTSSDINPCFSISILKTTNPINTLKSDIKITSDGYNICDKNNTRSVEREIEIKFTD
ncbi:TPA: hypothetical protein DIC38_01380 [Candidatus Nomurabacteria bacterium]|nr:MAG: hypothetical protein O210_OD1C00001G0454 [Parcubacteria bacterium RAAC4_OD1_1]HCY26318.1 hypothetical protein [Candidatus Nomurabacteria bacterium]